MATLGGIRARVDTRSKILNTESLPRGVTLVTGYFDVLTTEVTRALEDVRERTRDRPLAVAVLSRGVEILPGSSRAELVAALRMVDYVVTASDEDLNRLIERSQPAEVVRMEESDLRRMRRLIEHVQRRQNI